jgi:hypothetical protein
VLQPSSKLMRAVEEARAVLLRLSGALDSAAFRSVWKNVAVAADWCGGYHPRSQQCLFMLCCAAVLSTSAPPGAACHLPMIGWHK